VPELSAWEAVARLALAVALAGAIGLERELREHEAGLRTHMLVALGSALFTLVSIYAWADQTLSSRAGLSVDPTRIAAQVVSGVGFLGAGTIIVRGLSVKGLTTAASLWVVAAVGMAAGAGFYVGAVGATALGLVSLYPLRLWSRRVLGDRPATGTLRVDVADAGRAGVLAEVERSCGQPLHVEVRDGTVTLTVRLGVEAAELLSRVASLDGVTRVEWAP
jgi:putative Mg2+ transporter-C (MgtC) family protein